MDESEPQSFGRSVLGQHLFGKTHNTDFSLTSNIKTKAKYTITIVPRSCGWHKITSGKIEDGQRKAAL